MSAPAVTAIIVTYNSPPVVRRVVEALLAQTVPVAHIAIVDCGSKDPSPVLALGGLSSKVSVFPQSNIGFAAGNNLAIGRLIDVSDYFVLSELATRAGHLIEHTREQGASANAQPAHVAFVFAPRVPR